MVFFFDEIEVVVGGGGGGFGGGMMVANQTATGREIEGETKKDRQFSTTHCQE